MHSSRLNRRLITILGIGWLGFAIATLSIRIVWAAPDVTLLIDRSYCEPAQWGQLADDYAALYQQHQRGQITLKQIVFYSDLGEDVTTTPPPPSEFADLKTYGKPNRDRQANLMAQYPNARLLQCNATTVNP